MQRENGALEKSLTALKQEVACKDGVDLSEILNSAIIELCDSQRAASLDQLYTLFSKRVQTLLISLAKHTEAP